MIEPGAIASRLSTHLELFEIEREARAD